MIFKRVELHNHSTESDGSMTAEELMEWAEKKEYGVVALTDHNTCSGHGKAHQAIQDKHLSVSLLEGVEVTTFYGHILALGLKKMIDITGLDPKAPEAFLKNCAERVLWPLELPIRFALEDQLRQDVGLI